MAAVDATGSGAGAGARGEARTRDDIAIAYEHWPAQGAVLRLALLHPLALDSSFWHPLVERLRGKVEILAVDCRGHGVSDKPEGPYTVELLAADLGDVMDEIGWQSAIVGGASLGGCVALAFAAAHGDKVDGLALMDTTAWFGPGAAEAWAARADKAAEGGLKALLDFYKTRWFSDAYRKKEAAAVEATMRTFLDNDADAFREACLMLGTCDLRDVLEDIEVPVTIVVGEEDFATPIVMATALREGINGATLEVVKGARHLAALEAPDAVAGYLSALIDRVEAG